MNLIGIIISIFIQIFFFLNIIIIVEKPLENMASQRDSRTYQNILISSLSSSVISTVLTNPIEVAKLKMQYAPTSCPNYPHPNYRQLIRCDCVAFSLRDAFKGLSIVVPQVVLSNAIFMQLYEYQRSVYIEHMGSTSATALSSMVSRLIVSTAMNPIEAFRVRKVNSNQNNKIQTSQRALKVTLVRDLVFSTLYWSMIETVRNYYTGKQYRGSSNDGNFDANAIAGIVGGGLISAITTPLDTIKTRIQSGIKLQGSIWKQLKTIYHKQGLTGLFSGVHFRAMKSGLHSASYLIIYESILSSLRKSSKNKFDQ